MSKTYKRNDGWKRDRRDQNFRRSKKFKELKHNGHKPLKPNLLPVEMECIETDDVS